MSKSKGNVVDPLEVMEQLRHRRVPLHARRPRRPGPRHPSVRRAHRGLPQLRQQAVERRALRALEPRGLRPALARKAPAPPGRALDPEPAAPRTVATVRKALDGLSVQRRGLAPSTSSSGTSTATGISRSPSARSTGRRTRRRGRVTQRRWSRCSRHAAAAPPVHAVHHRGDLAAPPEGQGRAGEHHDLPLPAGPSARPGPRRRGGHGPDHGRHQRSPEPAERAPDPPVPDADGIVRPPAGTVAASLQETAASMAALARAEIQVDPEATRPPRSLLAIAEGCEVYVPVEGVVDIEAERGRLVAGAPSGRRGSRPHRGQARPGGLPAAGPGRGGGPGRGAPDGAAGAPGEAPRRPRAARCPGRPLRRPSTSS